MNHYLWHGTCLDTGTQPINIRLRRTRAYYQFMGGKRNHCGSNCQYHFRNDRQFSVGLVIVKIPITDEMVLTNSADIVSSGVPLHIGLNLLDKYRLFVGQGGRRMESRTRVRQIKRMKETFTLE